jgi:hypothetical protein
VKVGRDGKPVQGKHKGVLNMNLSSQSSLLHLVLTFTILAGEKEISTGQSAVINKSNAFPSRGFAVVWIIQSGLAIINYNFLIKIESNVGKADDDRARY